MAYGPFVVVIGVIAWLENYKETEEQQSNKYSEADRIDKKGWLPHLFREIPHFQDEYYKVQAEYDKEVKFKSLYNGEIVRDITGLQGKELGEFMRWHREYYGMDRLKADILKLNPILMVRWIEYFQEEYDSSF